MNLVYGTIYEQDLNGDLHQYRVQLSTGILSPWCPALTRVAGTTRHNHPFSIGTQVALMLGDYEGLILGALNSSMYPALNKTDQSNTTAYDDGAMIEYNSATHHLKAVLPTGASTEIVSDGGITLTGDLVVIGNISASQDISDQTRSMRADRAIYNSHTHIGDSGGMTSSTGQAQ